jgi:hypothetical protein
VLDDPPQGTGFMVNEKAVAVYGSGLQAISEQYIKNFNASFWEHQLSLIASLPKEDVPHDHVSFLRLTLSHAEEHLFALIFAALQAPHCPDLWLYRYAPSDLPEMVTKVMDGKSILTRFGLPSTSWLEIVKALWPNLDSERYRLTVLMLERLADHFVSTFGRDEYNGLKHGVRLSFGGMSVSFSPGGSPEIKPPPESYITLGDSKFGSRFWNLKQIKGSKNHFHAALCLSNWDYEELSYFLSHTILLIENMGAAFRTHAQIEGDRTFRFFRANEAYEKVRHGEYGSMTMEKQRGPEPSPQQLLDLEEVRKRYS